jgi:hypothetical protein
MSFWKGHIHSAGWEMPSLIESEDSLQRLKEPTAGSYSEINPVTFISYLFKIYFNIIVLFITMTPEW